MSEKITAVQRRLLEEVADLHGVPEGAYNIRANGHLASRQTTANISIESKTDVSGIDIRIKPGTVNESVHIPVVLSESGLKEMVYNDFYIGEGSDVLIVAGCGIDNCGSQDSQHDGLHRFFVEKNAHVRYVEKHYGSGDGAGKRLLNPGTEVHLAQGSSMEMEMVQIRGVDSTIRTTTAELEAGARLVFGAAELQGSAGDLADLPHGVGRDRTRQRDGVHVSVRNGLGDESDAWAGPFPRSQRALSPWQESFNA